MSDSNDDKTLARHLEHLAVDTDDIVSMINAHHAEGGDMHPEALGKAERLQTSLRDVIHALNRHDHLAMGPDDVWSALTVKHQEHDTGIS